MKIALRNLKVKQPNNCIRIPWGLKPLFLLCFCVQLSLGWLFAQSEAISLETTIPIGEEMRLEINAEGMVETEGLQYLREEVVQGVTFSYYAVRSRSITIRGSIIGFDCSGQQVTRLDLSRAHSLKTLFAYRNQLASIDLLANRALDFVDLSYNALTAVSIPSLPNLRRLVLYDNALTRLSIGECPKLNYLDIHCNRFSQDACESIVRDCPLRESVGTLVAVDNKQEEGNRFSMKSVKLAKSRGWSVFDYNGSPFSLLPYRGFDYEPQVSNRLITLTSTKPRGAEISISIKTEDPYRVEGAELLSDEGKYTGEKTLKLRLQGDIVKLYGDVTSLDCSNTGLSQLDLSTESLLSSLVCRENELKSLDLTLARQLKQLDCSNNMLAEIALGSNQSLTLLGVANNQLSDENAVSLVRSLTSKGDAGGVFKRAILFDSQKSSERNHFSAEAVRLLKSKGFTPLAVVNGRDRFIYYKGCDYTPRITQGAGITFETGRSVGEQVLLEITPVNGEDCAVSGATLLYLDTPGDTPYEVYRIDRSQISITGSISRLDLGDCDITKLDCSSASTLTCLLLVNNPRLQTLDLSANKHLQTLQIVGCGIKDIDLTDLTQLRYLYAGYSALRQIDLSQNRQLELANLDKLHLVALDLGNNEKLRSLSCSENSLPLLDLSAQLVLEDLDCSHNALSQLVLPSTAPLAKLNVSNNRLQTLPLGSLHSLQQITCYGNQIDSLRSTDLFERLPRRSRDNRGRLLFCDSALPSEGNSAYQQDVQQGENRGWIVLDFNGSPMRAKPYKGLPAPSSTQTAIRPPWTVVQVGKELRIGDLPIGETLQLFSPVGSLLYETVVRDGGVSIDISNYPRQAIILISGESKVVYISHP